MHYSAIYMFVQGLRGKKGEQRGIGVLFASHSPLEGLTLHQRRQVKKKETPVLLPGSGLTATAKHHNHVGFTLAFLKEKYHYFKDHQSTVRR